MCVMYRSVLLVLLGVFAPTEAYQPRWQSPSTPTIINNNSNSNNQAVSAPLDGTRRSAMRALPLAFVAMASPSMAQALDMDAFMAKELDSSNNKNNNNNKNDGSKKMSDDEALCRFGAPAKETGNACLRAGLPTKRPTGVDAFGSVDRGDFVRCKPNYVDDPKRPGMLINVWDCK
eukprot:jgi/Psemu1/290174/fgenesh1_pg.460_\